MKKTKIIEFAEGVIDQSSYDGSIRDYIMNHEDAITHYCNSENVQDISIPSENHCFFNDEETTILLIDSEVDEKVQFELIGRAATMNESTMMHLKAQ